MSKFTDQVVIVTGAAGNMGRAVAWAFAGQGARIALVDRDAQALEQIRAALPAGTVAIGITTDLMNPESVARMSAAVMEQFGRVDVLANLAGGFTMGPPIHETADHDWTFMLDLNARTVFNCCRAVVPLLLAGGGGHIVNVAARAATRGIGRMGPYCASKAAVITLTESLADELKDQGITVNCILPGTVDTPQNRAAMPDQDHDRWVSLAALADVILFLASDAARAVTGAAVPVYGRS
ncbi:MAG: SDR family oxidoreductase [Lamprocystis purpurea]|jgi:NAD(P)-dependent dehydrogenase (short-subunit alcohol dehydrogenase family)|uniref:SDR family NAD(P)-dependent oxidoreductase n=1 Tax=Lamprocystis purpurea TaxID=61598 RepID=UPI00036ACC8B|nr:SDR family NAD(P)-dependent oxidoreductase [Lamprocystis purpurea]MBV5275771.1 SDR family oxidoreductase [Lamprocystis purpurea]